MQIKSGLHLFVQSFILVALLACDTSTPDKSDTNLSTNDIATELSANSADTSSNAETALHTNVLTLDSHIDISFDFATEQHDPLTADIQANLEKMASGGLDAGFFIVYVGQAERTPENYAKAHAGALTKFLAIHRMTDELYRDRIGLAYSADDVERIVSDGKLAAMIGIENGFVFGKDLSLLNYYHDLGARYVTLVHNGHNDIGDSAQPREQYGDTEYEHQGLSEFGIEAVKRMNELGIMVDISHASKATALHAIATSSAPVIASHSSVNGVLSHPRNLDDETLDKLKDNGGVVHIVAFNSYLKAVPAEYTDARRALNTLFGFEDRADLNSLDDNLREDYLRQLNDLEEQYPGANVSDLVDHIDYAVNRIGIDHVGISSDFGGGGGIDGWRDATETPNVTAELIRRGYSEDDIKKLWSGNLLRVWRAVEQQASTTPN